MLCLGQVGQARHDITVPLRFCYTRLQSPGSSSWLARERRSPSSSPQPRAPTSGFPFPGRPSSWCCLCSIELITATDLLLGNKDSVILQYDYVWNALSIVMPAPFSIVCVWNLFILPNSFTIAYNKEFVQYWSYEYGWPTPEMKMNRMTLSKA